jgi:two-component system, sensor histidine kinase RegB
VVNVVRKLGGTVTAENHRKRGATVRLVLPLSTLAIGGGFDA